jgi:autotransporter-associated beta strand protein
MKSANKQCGIAGRTRGKIGSAVATVVLGMGVNTLAPRLALAVDWNGTDPGSSATSVDGLTGNYGQFTDESVIFNDGNSTRGTCTYLGNGWILTAQHVVEGSGGYGTLAPTSQIQVNVYGTYYTADSYQGFGSSDIMLVHLAGADSGPIVNLQGVERSQIYTGSSETGNLEQLGGFGYYGQLNSGTNGTDASFHRGFNIAYADGGFIDVSATGSSRLVQDGYVLGYQQAGDSGSGLWMDNGPDQDLNLRDWSLIGVLDTGDTPGYFGDGGQYARVSSYAGTIISTVFPNAWLTWNANTASTTATDGSGTWNLTTANFTDGANYAFDGPEPTQIATFGAGNGAAGTVTLGSSIPIDTIAFNAAGSGSYTIAGGIGTLLELTSDSTITANVDATISANMVGYASNAYGADQIVRKTGAGNLTLTGQTTLNNLIFNQRAGEITIGSGGSFTVNNAWLSVGVYTGDTATLTVAGTGTVSNTGNSLEQLILGDIGGSGTLNVQDTATINCGSLYIGKGSSGLTGSGGTGLVNQMGGTITAPYVSMGTNHPLSSGTYNLNGGSLITAAITGGLGSSTFNFNGGQIIASANSTSLMQNLTSATIDGGAMINTNGYNVTLNQPLSHSSGAPASDGGLTKFGAGTLTIGGASTYTGPTVINAGTLTLDPVAGAVAVAIQPVAAYSFDQVSGSTVINSGTGGAAMNGTLTGDATIVSGGKFGNAVQLSGNGSVVVNSPITDTGGAANWTLSAWVNTTTPGAAIMDKSDGGWTWDNSVFYLGSGNGGGSGGVPSAVRYGRGFFQAAPSTPPVDDGAWHMVTYVDAAGSYAIYQDGNPVALSSANAGFMQAVEQGSTVSFGITTDSFSGDGTVNFNGMLDEIQIYNRALTAPQIQGLYTSDSPNPAPASSVLPALSAVTVATGASLDLNGVNQTIGALSGSSGSSIILGTGQLTVSSPLTTIFAGSISGQGGSLVKSGNGTLMLSGSTTYTGGTTVTAGKLLIEPTSATTSALPTGVLSITGGTVQLADNVTAGTALATSNVNLTSLSITGDGTFDIGNNRIIIDYSSPATDPIASIKTWIRNGYFRQPGPEIISSDIATDDAASGQNYGIGYADGADGVVAGLPSGEIEIMFTLLGDANLDGTVNSEDFSQFSHNLGQSGMMWDDGDFNYDGTVNSEDFSLFSTNLGQSASLATAAGVLELANNGLGLANVPEPACAGMMVMAGLGILSRRRQSSRNSI